MEDNSHKDFLGQDQKLGIGLVEEVEVLFQVDNKETGDGQTCTAAHSDKQGSTCKE